MRRVTSSATEAATAGGGKDMSAGTPPGGALLGMSGLLCGEGGTMGEAAGAADALIGGGC